MFPDKLNFAPQKEQELHNFHQELMQFFPTTLTKSLVRELFGLAQTTITGHNTNLITEFTIPHFNRIASDLHAIPSEVSLLGIFSAQRLNYLRDTHLVELGVRMEPRAYLFESTVEAVVSGFSSAHEMSIQGADLANIRAWCFSLKQFSDEYMTLMTLPNLSYEPKRILALIHEFPSKIEGLRTPIENLIDCKIDISFTQ